MIKRLTKHGNSRALLLDAAVLDLLKIDDNTPLEITTNGLDITISPVRDADREKLFQLALEDGNRRLGPAMKALASK